MAHTSEIVRTPPRPAPVVRPLEKLDTVDRAILQLVHRAPSALTPEYLSDVVNNIVDGRSTPSSIGKRLRVFSAEKRLMYVSRDGERYAMPMPGSGFRKAAAGRERGAGTIDSPLPSSPLRCPASQQDAEV